MGRVGISLRKRGQIWSSAAVPEMLAKAEAADAAEVPAGMSIREELARREERLRKIAEARAKIEARAKERYERELAEHEAKLAARAARTAETGKKARGKPPEPPAEGPLPKDQINLTDEDSRIMPVAGGGFDQCTNAQAAVAAGARPKPPPRQRECARPWRERRSIAAASDAAQGRGRERRERRRLKESAPALGRRKGRSRWRSSLSPDASCCRHDNAGSARHRRFFSARIPAKPG